MHHQLRYIGVAVLLIVIVGTWWYLASREPGVSHGQEAPLASVDWPHLRGPGYDGVSAETGLMSQWPEPGPPILWSRELGQGYSGFVSAGERIYTQYQTLAGQFVLCFERDTGKTVWETRYDWPWQARGAYPGPYASPTLYESKVYFASPAGMVGCLRADNGAWEWSRNVLKDFGGRGAEFGFAATPLIHEGQVFLPVGGKQASVVALSAQDGSTTWTTGTDPGSYCGIFPIKLAGRAILVGYLRNSIVLLNPSDGKELWRQNLSSEYDEHSAWPLYVEPILCFSAPFRAGTNAYRLGVSDGEIQVKPLWLQRQFSNDVASSVATEGHLFGFDLKDLQSRVHRPSRGWLRCMDLATGNVRWSTDEVGHVTILVADKKLWMLDDTGLLIVAHVIAERYEEFGRARVLPEGLSWTPPHLSQGRLLLRNATHLACVFVGDPSRLPTGAEPMSPANVPTHRPWRISQLLTREPEYPDDAPSWREYGVWSLASLLGVLLPAWMFAAAVPATLRTAVALTLMFLLGALGTSLYSLLFDTFVFTWPTSLFAVWQANLVWMVHVEQQPVPKPRWQSRLSTMATLGVLYLYFELCRSIGLVAGWGFLIGLAPASIPAWWAARSAKSQRWIWAIIWHLVAIATCYGSGAVFIRFRMEGW